jgi:GAF domain-containing protein
MTTTSRDAALLQTFATLADTLVDDYDIVDLLQTLVDACHEHLDIAAAGILLADSAGNLEVVASTSEASRLVELMQLAALAGPCVECYRTGLPIAVPDISAVPPEWADFRDSALAYGFAAADAVPLRLRETTIGTLNLLRREAGPPSPADLAIAQAFGDVATIGVIHERSLRESEILSQQLQLALSSRVLIEQAKGVVSYMNDVPIDEAFQLIRGYARRHRLPLSRVAHAIVERRLRLHEDSQ